jgi:two-component system sensor histidine kinase KdpD
MDSMMSSPGRYIIAAMALAVTVAILIWQRSALNQTSIALLLVLAVVVAAVVAGRGPAMMVALLAGLAFNFFFLPPYHSLRIHDPEDAVGFVVFAATAVLVGHLATRLRRRTVESEQQQRALDLRAAEAETLRRSEQLKGALLDAVTHDLRTPLTSIKAAATTLRAAVAPEVRDELCGVIEEETDRLDHFVQGMLDFARLRAGEVTLESREVSAEEIIENALLRAEPLVSDHEITVNADAELALRADPRLIAQVLFALLENAARYSPRGSRIAISASPRDDSVCFSVVDQGPGIPPEVRSRVFEHFYRGNESSGTGMGLAIARRIVEAHGGNIWIEGDGTGHGSEFRFLIPRRSAA